MLRKMETYLLQSFAVLQSSLLSSSVLNIDFDDVSSSKVESGAGEIVDGVEVAELVPLSSEVLAEIGVEDQCLSESPKIM